MLAVQKYLQTHTLEDLTRQYGIKTRAYEDRVVLNYGIIDSKKHKFHPIVKECRALILELPTFRILSRAFDRFFNLNEDPDSKNFPISQAVAYEKIDGSLISLYHDGSKWCVATRGMAFAEGECMYGNGETFYDLFMEASGLNNLQDFRGSENWTYIFEIVGPKSRVVKPYSSTELYLLGERRKDDGLFIPPEHIKTADVIKYKLPKTWEFKTVDDCLAALKELPTFDEGYVLLDNTWDWRIKVKSPAYLAIAHLKSNGRLSEKRVIEMIFNDSVDEYLIYFPDDKDLIAPYQKAVAKIYSESMEHFNNYGDMHSRKKFAKIVKDLPISNILFRMKDGYTIDEALERTTQEGKVKLVKAYMQ